MTTPVLTLPLNDGHAIPQLGLGFWQVEPGDVAPALSAGLKAGYRLIDTAQGYENEEAIGTALQGADVPVSDLYITSKLRNRAQARGDALRAFDDTMRKLKVDVLDLFLIHWPLPKRGLYVEAWKTLVDLQKQGRIRSIGVSNFTRDHLTRIIGETGVTPAVNQIELHPRFQQQDLRAFHREHGIVTQSWSPLGSGRLLGDPAIAVLAGKHGRSVAQIILRWHIQEGLVVIPKSIRPERIAENIALFDFELDSDDMAALASLDRADGRNGPDPTEADFLF